MRVYELIAETTGRERGRAHGEAFRGEIDSLATLRTHLARVIGGFESDAQVLSTAGQHLDVLAAFDRELHDELIGIAEGAATTPERIVVLNHYTDLRDLGRRQVAEPDGCSILWAPTAAGVITGQTWDMHASAMPYVMMLRDPGVGQAPGAWLLSLTGCLGMAGVNDAGVAVLINNLTSTDARVGVVWSALVRRALRERDSDAAFAIIKGAPVGSGHHYLVADGTKARALETSGERKAELAVGPGPYVHTNHCLEGTIAERSVVPDTSTTRDRYQWLANSLDRDELADLDDAWNRLGSVEGYPRSVCSMMATPENPHAPATCGAIVANLSTGEIRAVAGLTHGVAGERFRVGEGTVE